VSPKRFQDPTLDQGEDGRILLSALDVFGQGRAIASGVKQLGAKARLHPDEAFAVIEHLVDGRFLQPTR
jgi:hypothetical protein